MPRDDSFSVESLMALSEDDRTKKLSKLNEQEQIAVVYSAAIQKITEEWCDEAVRVTQRAVDQGEVITQKDKPNVIKMFGAAMGYLSLLENATSELVREELMTQDKGSQELTENADLFLSKVKQIRNQLSDASDLMDEWLSRRMIRRELRLNVDAAGVVTPISAYESKAVEPAYITNTEEGQTNE